MISVFLCVYMLQFKNLKEKKDGSHKYNLKKPKVCPCIFLPFFRHPNSQQGFTRTTPKMMCIQQKWKADLSFKEFVNYLGKCNI